MPVTVLDAAAFEGGTCPVTTDSGCAAGSVAPGSIPWVPPHAQPTACTSQQIDAFYAACIGPSSTDSACKAFGSAVDTAACYFCIFSLSTDPTYGAIVYTPFPGGLAYTELNTGGCIAVLDPCNAECGHAVQALARCQDESCKTGCLALADFKSCVAGSQMCGTCLGYYEVANDCSQSLIRTMSAGATCVLPEPDYETAFKVTAQSICSKP